MLMTTMCSRAPRVMGERRIEGKRKEMNERVSHKDLAKREKIKKLQLNIRETSG